MSRGYLDPHSEGATTPTQTRIQAHELTASEASAEIRAGRLTSEALVHSCLARITERDGTLRAWAHIHPKDALAAARIADRVLAQRGPMGPLHGVPVGIKDVIDTADLPTENGTPVFARRRPSRDATVVARLRAAGAVILGKTETTELAFFGPGPTRNPHDPERTPGGSSSGSAAAVADRHVPLALGTQTAGSVLRPASYCGVLGWKPTFGLISRTGVLAQSGPLDTIGAFARSIEDLALITDVLSGVDTTDPVTVAAARLPSLSAALAQAQAAAVRLAFVRTGTWELGEPAMQGALLELVARLGPETVAEIELPVGFPDILATQRAVQFHDIAEAYGPLVAAHPSVMSAKLAEVVAIGKRVPSEEYAAAIARREAVYRLLLKALDGFDAILTPAAPGVAPRGLGSTGSPAFNFIWTYLGVPAISMPLLSVEGLPLGVQLVGRRGADAALLATARTLGRLLA